MRRNILLSALLSIVGGVTLCFAQDASLQRDIERGISLYNYGHTIEARQELLAVRKQLLMPSNRFALEKVDYYISLCNNDLLLREAEQSMKSYLSTYPGSAYSNDVQFALGVHYCVIEDFEAADEVFDKVNYRSLDTRNRDKYDLRMGYLAFLDGDMSVSKQHFTKIPKGSIYHDHAVYYLSYMAYADGDTAKAREGFEALTRSPQYRDLMPYYLLQLDFKDGEYEKVIAQGDALIEKSVKEYAIQIRRIMAESYFQLSDYANAVRYINDYRNSGGEMGRVENYILGYSLYRQTVYDEAEHFLRETCGADDMLTQNAAYHLADCYVKLGDKPNALNSFAMAAASDYDKAIKEDALFNYAKLQYELDDGLFNKTINVLTRYVEEYPSSERVQEAKALLVAAYFNSRNYDDAYDAIKRMQNPDGEIQVALQKITYFKGLEAFVEGDLAEAESAFAESRNVGLDAKYNALNIFWLGEIAYSRGDYDMALHHYRQYLALAPRGEREYAMAQYNIGYCYFSSSQYEQSAAAFDRFLEIYSKADDYRADALNRRGDVAYSNRDFQEAVGYYDAVRKMQSVGRYYAEYQRAMTLGAQNNRSAKITALEAIVTADRGDYVDDAYYELGRSYIANDQYDKGVDILEKFIAKYPDAEYSAQALLDLGLAHTNLGNEQKAMAYYDEVIRKAPQSAQSKSALEGVRDIYLSDGDAESYFKYAEQVGLEGDLDVVARDSMSYVSAQRLYLDNKVESAARSFESYLRNYPEGHYVNDALFFMSDCYMRAEQSSNAIESLSRLVKQGKTQYNERALESLSYLCYQTERYAEAATAYRALYDETSDATKRKNAASGYISSVLKYADDDTIIAMADDMEQMPEVTDVARRKARYAKSEALMKAGKEREAMKVYELLATEVKSAEGAEAYYRLLEAEFVGGNDEKAEQMIMRFAESKTPQNYWLAKAFLILGDIYLAKGDTFQARSTYQSVVDGYSPDNDGIVAEAKSKISKLN